MLQNPNIVEEKSENEYTIQIVRGSHRAIKYLMGNRVPEAKRELLYIEGVLENSLNKLKNDEFRPQFQAYHENVKRVLRGHI